MGNNVTHVANGSHHDIYVTGSFYRGGPMRCEYTKIAPGVVHAFPGHPSSEVFLTIFFVDGRNPGCWQPVCEGYRLDADRSVVIDKNNQVHRVCHGALWRGENGNNYWRPTNN